jgi:ADP-heptose:LPS heptosyltransferase
MPRRQRWTPVRGTGNRIYDPAERRLLGALDLGGRLVAGALRAARIAGRPLPPPEEVREVLVLRLDRIGDVLMSLPALGALRAALPGARIRLAVGRWSEEIAARAPVDEVLVWSAPWAARRGEARDAASGLWRRARALRRDGLDLALDLQGDLRANLLLALTGARRRVGYANTGGAYLLTDVVPLDETISWVDQNQAAVAAALRAAGVSPPAPVGPSPGEDREKVQALLGRLGLSSARRPLVGVHPSGGRTVKQWDPGRWAEVAARLEKEFGATVVVTGSEADRPLAAAVARGLAGAAVDLTGRLGVRESMAVIAGLDLFLSPDTGPMHMACAMGTPSVAVFGPSDPVRYFSGRGLRHAVVRAELWCSPCNLIRKPPAECAGPELPECLRLVTVEAVYREAARLLAEVGGYRRLAAAAGAP